MYTSLDPSYANTAFIPAVHRRTSTSTSTSDYHLADSGQDYHVDDFEEVHEGRDEDDTIDEDDDIALAASRKEDTRPPQTKPSTLPKNTAQTPKGQSKTCTTKTAF